jgi:thioredoxin-dependent peroxiredoxin
MSIRLGDEAPDFTAETTEGAIRFHDWIGDKWAVLFSHPKDFTPVCSTQTRVRKKERKDNRIKR